MPSSSSSSCTYMCGLAFVLAPGHGHAGGVDGGGGGGGFEGRRPEMRLLARGWSEPGE
jgi:hypothetical protein